MSEMSAVQAPAQAEAQAQAAAGKLESARAKWDQQVEPALFAGLLGTLVWCSIPLGSNRPWPMGLMAMVMAVLVSGVALGWLLRQRVEWPSQVAAARWPLALLLGYAGLVLLQLMPLPDVLLAVLAPGTDGTGVVSVDPFNTRRYLLATFTYLSAFVLVLSVVQGERRVKQLLLALVLAGALQAVLAVVLYGRRVEYQFMGVVFNAGGRLAGTFANWNHLAGYMEMCIAAGVGLMLSDMRGGSKGSDDWRQQMQGLLRFALSPKMLVRLLLVVMVIALVMSRSRMGNIAFFSALLVTGGVCMLRSAQLRNSAKWLIISLIVVDVVVVGQWVGLDKVVKRIEATSLERDADAGKAGLSSQPQRKEESLEERLQAARDSLAMVWQRPWLGHGGGSFHAAFTPYKSEKVTKYFFDHTHNDYVEVAADTGLLGLAAWIGVALLSLLRCWRCIRDDVPTHVRGVAVGVFMAIWCLGVHSLVDFNLQIPANALTFTVLLALPWCLQPEARQRRRRRSRSSEDGQA